MGNYVELYAKVDGIEIGRAEGSIRSNNNDTREFAEGVALFHQYFGVPITTSYSDDYTEEGDCVETFKFRGEPATLNGVEVLAPLNLNIFDPCLWEGYFGCTWDSAQTKKPLLKWNGWNEIILGDCGQGLFYFHQGEPVILDAVSEAWQQDGEVLFDHGEFTFFMDRHQNLFKYRTSAITGEGDYLIVQNAVATRTTKDQVEVAATQALVKKIDTQLRELEARRTVLLDKINQVYLVNDEEVVLPTTKTNEWVKGHQLVFKGQALEDDEWEYLRDTTDQPTEGWEWVELH